MGFEIGTLCLKVHVSIDSYVLNSKSAAFQSIWLKFGQSDAIYRFYKTGLRILILLFISKLELFSTGSGD